MLVVISGSVVLQRVSAILMKLHRAECVCLKMGLKLSPAKPLLCPHQSIPTQGFVSV